MVVNISEFRKTAEIGASAQDLDLFSLTKSFQMVSSLGPTYQSDGLLQIWVIIEMTAGCHKLSIQYPNFSCCSGYGILVGHNSSICRWCKNCYSRNTILLSTSSGGFGFSLLELRNCFHQFCAWTCYSPALEYFYYISDFWETAYDLRELFQLALPPRAWW